MTKFANRHAVFCRVTTQYVYMYVISQIESEETVMRRQLASHLLQENGALLTSAIVNACVTCLPSQLLGDVGEILYEMLRTEREVGPRWHRISRNCRKQCQAVLCFDWFCRRRRSGWVRRSPRSRRRAPWRRHLRSLRTSTSSSTGALDRWWPVITCPDCIRRCLQCYRIEESDASDAGVLTTL